MEPATRGEWEQHRKAEGPRMSHLHGEIDLMNSHHNRSTSSQLSIRKWLSLVT